MNVKNLATVTALGVTFVLLFYLFLPQTLPITHPGWWYDTLGENAFSALLWVQLVHSLSVVLAAVFAAIGIVFLFPGNRYFTAFAVASFLVLVFVYDIARAYLILDGEYSSSHIISSAIDVVKIYLIVFGAVYLLSMIKTTFNNQESI